MNHPDDVNRIWLLVECSSLLVKLEKSLEKAGFRLPLAQPEPGPVKEILERIEAFKPGVVLLQAGCNGFDTFEISRQLKADPRFRSIPLILFGCENHAQNSVKTFRAGAAYYVALGGEDCLCLVRLVEKLTGKRPV